MLCVLKERVSLWWGLLVTTRHCGALKAFEEAGGILSSPLCSEDQPLCLISLELRSGQGIPGTSKSFIKEQLSGVDGIVLGVDV